MLPVEPYLYCDSAPIMVKVRFGMCWWMFRESNHRHIDSGYCDIITITVIIIDSVDILYKIASFHNLRILHIT